MSKISVVMSTYKESVAHIQQSVDSILNQTLSDFELIIVLDDPTNKDAEAFLDGYAQQDKRIVLLKNKKNLGLVGSLNRALGVATGEYAARMDAGDISFPNRFEAQLEYLTEHNLDIVSGLIEHIDHDGNELPGYISKWRSSETIMKSLPIDDCMPHSLWFLKTSVYKDLNGYRNMPRCEDYDFLLRALKKGYTMGLCNQPLMYVRISPDGISTSGLLKQYRASRYIARNFRRIEHLTPEEVHIKAYDTVSEKQAQNFLKAEDYFIKALKHKRSNPLKLFGCLVCAAASSSDFILKFYNMFRLRFVRLLTRG